MSRRMMLAAASEWMSATIENRLMVHARFPSTGSNTFHHFSSFRNFVSHSRTFCDCFLSIGSPGAYQLGSFTANKLTPPWFSHTSQAFMSFIAFYISFSLSFFVFLSLFEAKEFFECAVQPNWDKVYDIAMLISAFLKSSGFKISHQNVIWDGQHDTTPRTVFV